MSRPKVDVLVVDDDRDMAEELCSFMEKSGLACEMAGDGWAALKLLSEGCRPSVVVSDLGMPELNGLQFAEHINKMRDGDRPEIIFVSGTAGYDDAVEAIRLGARDMLTKPVESARLVRSVKSAMLVRQLRQDGQPAAKDAALAPEERRRQLLEDLRAVRKVRSRYFPSELFSDPCWEMLLDLYDGRLAGQEVTIMSLAAASGAALTTALRRMDTLQSHGLIERKLDPNDKRRTIVTLSAAGIEAVERFFDTYARRL